SAMMEWPIAEQITLDDLIDANRLLVSCGASIAEINAVRRAISAIKGGRLAALAPHATQLTLIISDTNPGDEASVASGPTIEPLADAPDASAVVAGYTTLKDLPASILSAVNDRGAHARVHLKETALRKHYVLLDNRRALEAAALAARRYGLLTEIAYDLVEPRIEEGCASLLSRLDDLRSQAALHQQPACLISGGEFLCPVRGEGIGGRNAETVLRCAIEIDQQNKFREARQVVVLSAGTDGIDGNSPAAGAIADETTLRRARSLHLDARSFLDASDAFRFFSKLGDAIGTGTTGTNVRDVRLLLAR
ncbi:MAG TPA: MOFRL family protein, partial [Pyrinomonadaceae bacterium]|nr:MOFRL family protein [Pyrinomonadaceae bacterium]